MSAANAVRSWRDIMARNDEASADYFDEAFAVADDEARANLAAQYAEACS